MQKITNADLPLGDCLVAAQVLASPGGIAKEQAQGAKLPTAETIESLEEFIRDAPTGQLRVYAAVLVAMTNASGRASDFIRSRNLSITERALLAEARMNNSQFWTPWVAIRSGLVLKDWAGELLAELALHDLPGADFVAYGINEAADKWLPRPAEFKDVEIALRILLQLSGLSAEEATEFSPHSMKHFQISFALQLGGQA